MATPNLPLQTIVDVVVQVSPQAPTQPTFNQGLIIGNSGIINSQTTRLVKITSANDLLSLGFTTSSPEYLAAQIYFSQLTPALFLWVGAQDPSGLNTVIPHVASEGTGYVVGDILAVVQGPAVGGTVSVSTIGVGGTVTGTTLLTSGHGYSVANGLTTTGGSGVGAQVDISSIGEPALQAAIACRNARSDWYEFCVLGASSADVSALATWAQSATPVVTYFYVTADVTVLNNTPGNFAAVLKAAAFNRVIGVYSTAQGGLAPNNIYADAALMGVACGLTTGLANSFFTLKFKQLVGITTEPLSINQVGNVESINVNLYLNFNNSFNVFEQGKMADGSFFYHISNLDILVSNIQFSVMGRLVSTPAIPQSDPGETQIIQAVNEAAAQSALIGFIAGGVWKGVQIINLKNGDSVPNGYLAQAYPFSTQSAANRAAGQAMPVYLAIIEAGAIHFVVIGVYVQR